MASPSPTLRSRTGNKERKQVNGKKDHTEEYLNGLTVSSKKVVTSEWDFKLGLVVITVLSFVTRFWGISHPNEVVFDEVHFGKVRYCP
jgi:dolichyl-phosphate-mannose-protein mannosyltransferase